MKAKLIGIGDAKHSEAVHFEDFPVLVGRASGLQWTLDDRWVSRRHCEINYEHGELVVRDLGSKHGTFVNNRQIETAVLAQGDKLSIGMCTFVVSYEHEDMHLETGAGA